MAFTTLGTLTEEISEKTFRKERRSLQAKHLRMEVKLSWHVLADRMYTAAPTGKSREQLYALLFNKAASSSQKNPYEKAYRGPAHKAVQAWWNNAKSGYCTPKVKVRHWSRTFRRHSRARKKMLVLSVLVFVCFVLVLPKTLHAINVLLCCEFPVVDRLCSVLARQYKEKKLYWVRACSVARKQSTEL